jgi:ATP-dependent Lon protease
MSENKPSVEYTADNLPALLPILPLFDAILFPKMVLPLVVMEKDSLKLVD